LLANSARSSGVKEITSAASSRAASREAFVQGCGLPHLMQKAGRARRPPDGTTRLFSILTSCAPRTPAPHSVHLVIVAAPHIEQKSWLSCGFTSVAGLMMWPLRQIWAVSYWGTSLLRCDGSPKAWRPDSYPRA